MLRKFRTSRSIRNAILRPIAGQSDVCNSEGLSKERTCSGS